MWINKIFSNYEDGENLYSVIMNEDEVALFSEKKELTDLEKLEIYGNKHLLPKFYKRNWIDAVDPDTPKEKLKKAQIKQLLIDNGILAGVAGLSAKGILKADNKTALLATGAIGLGGVAGTGVGLGLRNKFTKTNKNYRNQIKKQADKMRVSNGDMTEQEYINKYYKN